MTIVERRPAGGCLEPVLLDPCIDDPETIRTLARRHGPYFMPARYLVRSSSAASAADDGETPDVPSYLIGPTFRGDWAFDGEPLIDGAADLLHHQPFVDAARRMCASDEVVPEQVFVNLTGPSGGQPFSHVDIPEFNGINRSNAPGWLLQSMGASGLFRDAQITIITAVAWFHHGERGFFRYWPTQRDADSIRHEAMWNTAVVGDNDFMHHKVERTGPADLAPPDGMTIDTQLRHDGDAWLIEDGDQTLATYDDEHIRLSLSWKAKVYDDANHRERVESGTHALTFAEVATRFSAELGADEPVTADDLTSDLSRLVLSGRWSTYEPD